MVLPVYNLSQEGDGSPVLPLDSHMHIQPFVCIENLPN